MGQIQQAFNQSLATAAYFAQPAAIHKKEVEKAEKAAEKATEILANVAEKKNAKNEEFEIAYEGMEATHKDLYKVAPSEKTLHNYAVSLEGAEEHKKLVAEEEAERQQKNQAIKKKNEFRHSINEEMALKGFKGVSEYRGTTADQQLMVKAIGEMERDRFRPSVKEVIKTR